MVSDTMCNAAVREDRHMARRLGAGLLGCVLAVLLVACSDSGGSDSPSDSPPGSAGEVPAGSTPVLDRIDGPAQVDPSFDPMQVDPTAPGTESGG
jgi:hypothetical protein